MIADDYPFASVFLLVAATTFALAFALPLLIAPLAWARVFQWHVPAKGHDLLNYFGRCLGGVALAIIFCCFRAAPSPRENRIIFDLIIAVGALMTLVHVYGAIKRAQPWTETAEIGLYALLTLIAYSARATLG